MDEKQLHDALPAPIAGPVRSIKAQGGTVTVVADASGLDAAARQGLEAAYKDILGKLDGVDDVRVAMMADKVARKIVAIGSGKGGVGKSTLTANLAIALARMGKKVGVVDADIYGPSQPKILAQEGVRPEAEGNRLVPVPSKWGVPVLSMGHIVDPDKAIAWRGPMTGNALGQLIDAEWGDAELLLVDLPPGTGDVQLSMIQQHKPVGAVIVSTPQDLALIDAKRAMHLFEMGKVPVLGMVENMAGYACPHCGEISDPFGQGGVEKAAKELGLPFLGRIPLALEIREAGDSGNPPAAGDGPQAESFAAIARGVIAALDSAQGG